MDLYVISIFRKKKYYSNILAYDFELFKIYFLYAKY